MMLTPVTVIKSWRRRLWSVAIAFAGAFLILVWCVFRWHYTESRHSDSESKSSTHAAQRENEPAQFLWTRGRLIELLTFSGGLAFLCWTFGGRHFHTDRIFSKHSDAIPSIPAGEMKTILRPDGTQIHVEIRGSSDLPTVILTHGWSLNSNQWVYLQSDWQEKFRIVTWDLPGLGKSTAAADHDFRLETMAADLRAVIEETKSTSVVLLGHSIGGMLILVFCQLYPELLGSTVSKLVLVHTTYTNPLRTMKNAPRIVRLQKLLVEPLLYLQIYLSPIVWIMDSLAYWNGSLHWSLKQTGFAGSETPSQLDFVARFYAQDSPAILAQGALAMLNFDASQTLSEIKIPVLVIAGNEDPITVPEASHKIATEVQCGQIVILAPAKHFGLIEYHGEFAKRAAVFCLEAS